MGGTPSQCPARQQPLLVQPARERLYEIDDDDAPPAKRSRGPYWPHAASPPQPTTDAGGYGSGSQALFIIDPQIDFHPDGGSLPVPGAWGDAGRIAALIDRAGPELTNIAVSMDSHQMMHIAHRRFWRGRNGGSPAAFTTGMTSDEWTARFPQDVEVAREYLGTQGAREGFPHIVWPDHCIVGTRGWCVVDVIMDALRRWCLRTGREIVWVLKGECRHTEMFSAIQAAKPCVDEPRTDVNRQLLDFLNTHEAVYVCGQARSHCVNYTLKDILAECGSEKNQTRYWLLEDCASDIRTENGLKAGAELVADMRRRQRSIKGVDLFVENTTLVPADKVAQMIPAGAGWRWTRVSALGCQPQLEDDITRERWTEDIRKMGSSPVVYHVWPRAASHLVFRPGIEGGKVWLAEPDDSETPSDGWAVVDRVRTLLRTYERARGGVAPPDPTAATSWWRLDTSGKDPMWRPSDAPSRETVLWRHEKGLVVVAGAEPTWRDEVRFCAIKDRSLPDLTTPDWRIHLGPFDPDAYWP